MPNKWKQGEHVFIVGDTGQGKTYLEAKLLVYRKYVMYLKSKPDDIKFPGFRKIGNHFDIGRNPFDNGVAVTRWLLQPKFNSLGLQHVNFKQAFQRAWHEGGWTVVVDEAFFQTKKLKLGDDIDMLVTQGRSKNITMVVGVQRPAWISRFPMSQATHVFIFRCDGRDLKALGEAFSPTIIKPVQELQGHDFVYFNRATREVKTGNANRLGEIFG
jgi:hypothetical protein